MCFKASSISVGSISQELNEDCVGVGDKYLFVIDGATGLSGKNYMDDISDARWLARETAKLLHDRLPDNPCTIDDILMQGMKSLEKTWQGPQDDMPSVSLSVWRCNSNVMEYFGLGDCDASLRMHDGKILTWREDKLPALDAIVLERMTTLCKETGCTMIQAREFCNEQLIKHRNMRNQDNGYWCLDLTGSGIYHARSASFPSKDCESVFACSDGFSQLIGFQEVGSLEELHCAVREKGLSFLLDRLFSLQCNDKALEKLPRFKFRDDTSAAFAFLGG